MCVFIALIVFAYLLTGIALTYAYIKISRKLKLQYWLQFDQDDTIPVVLFWPVVVIFGVAGGFIFALDALLRKFVFKNLFK